MKDEIKVMVNAVNGEVLVKTMEMREYIDPGFNYTLESVASIIELVECRGDKEYSFLFYTDEEVSVVLDDSVLKRHQDRAKMYFDKSQFLEEWNEVLDRNIDQKQFIEFLKKREAGELENVAPLIASLQTLKLATEVKYDGDYNDNNNYVFGIKVKDMEGNTKLPATLAARIPLINESDHVVDIEIELQVNKPSGEGQKPTFVLTCPKMERYWKAAVKHEIETLKAGLPGYHILAGSNLN